MSVVEVCPDFSNLLAHPTIYLREEKFQKYIFEETTRDTENDMISCLFPINTHHISNLDHVVQSLRGNSGTPLIVGSTIVGVCSSFIEENGVVIKYANIGNATQLFDRYFETVASLIPISPAILFCLIS